MMKALGQEIKKPRGEKKWREGEEERGDWRVLLL